MPNLQTLALTATLLTTAFAGCVAPPHTPDTLETARAQTPEAATPATPEAPRDRTGSLVVVTRLPDLTPLPGVNVTVANATNVTDANGAARFGNLTEGFHEILATKPGHRPARAGVTVTGGEETYTEVTLQGTPEHLPPARDVPEPAHGRHNEAYEFVGYFDCSATYLIITGDCLLVVDHVAGETGLPIAAAESTNEKFVFDFPLDLGWRSVVAEMTWNAPNPAMGRDMTLALEPAEAPADGHAAKYARTSGESPLSLRLDAGVKHETATAEDMPKPEGGEVIRARAFVMGEAHNPGGTTFLGVGASMSQKFTIYATVFYEGPAPDGYTVIQGGDP